MLGAPRTPGQRLTQAPEGARKLSSIPDAYVQRHSVSHVALGLCSCLNPRSWVNTTFSPENLCPATAVLAASGRHWEEHTHAVLSSHSSAQKVSDTCESLLWRCVLLYVLEVYRLEKWLWQWGGRAARWQCPQRLCH